MRLIGNLQLRYSVYFLSILFLPACDKDKTPPGEVTDLDARGGAEKVHLTWTEPLDADLTSIQIEQVGANKFYALPSGFDSITIADLTNGINYEFAVVAVDDNGNKSNAVRTSATPSPPYIVVDPIMEDYEPEVYVQYSNGYQTLTPSATFEVDNTGRVHITATFNRPLDISSVQSGQTVYFQGTTVSPGDVSLSENNTILTFVSNQAFNIFGEISQSASYTIYTFDFILVGENAGNGNILDNEGIALDGDEDGLSGGDFVLELTVFEQIN
jgi:hypothetical protein